MRMLSLATLIVVPAWALSADAEKVRVLIVDGQNNHAWATTTPIMKKHFDAAGKFEVQVATSPPRANIPPKPKDATPEQEARYKEQVAELMKAQRVAMEKFRPDLGKIDVVVSNYNGEDWGSEFNADLDARVKEGKIGLVIVHAANNAFPGWKEYNQMIGMGWRDAKFGKRVKYDATGTPTVMDAGMDLGSGHRYTGPFSITLRNFEHPITKGMPPEWLHARDELYDNMRGPIEKITMLATAYSKGTMTHEPMIWTVSYGNGRVFHTPMGHDAGAMRCVGFAATLTRGTEWAATGKVTVELPKVFPTADKVEQVPEK